MLWTTLGGVYTRKRPLRTTLAWHLDSRCHHNHTTRVFPPHHPCFACCPVCTTPLVVLGSIHSLRDSSKKIHLPKIIMVRRRGVNMRVPHAHSRAPTGRRTSCSALRCAAGRCRSPARRTFSLSKDCPKKTKNSHSWPSKIQWRRKTKRTRCLFVDITPTGRASRRRTVRLISCGVGAIAAAARTCRGSAPLLVRGCPGGHVHESRA